MTDEECPGCGREFDSARGMKVHYGTEHGGGKPWISEEKIRELYLEQKLSIRDVTDEMGTSGRVLRKRMDECGIETRGKSEAVAIHERRKPAEFVTYPFGYEMWRNKHNGTKHNVLVHRLLAVAEWGFEAVCDKHVHHKDKIPWDNRPENLELMSSSEHAKHHRQGAKFQWREVVRIKEFYRNGDVSHRDLADMFDVSPTLIGDVVNEEGVYSISPLDLDGGQFA